MAFVEVNLDWENFKTQLGYFSDNMPRYAKQIMGAVNAQIVAETKKVVNGRGYARSKTASYGESAILPNIYSKGDTNYRAKVGVRRDAYYAWFIENGIPNDSPRKAKYLNFKVGGNWVKVKSVSIPARPFMKTIVDEYWNGGKAEPIMDKKLQQIINKLFKD